MTLRDCASIVAIRILVLLLLGSDSGIGQASDGEEERKEFPLRPFPQPRPCLKGTAGHLHTLPLAATPENAEGHGYTFIRRTQPGNWRRGEKDGQKREREINIQFLVNNARLGREGGRGGGN